MNSELPSREQAIKFLETKKCSIQVIKHCIAVANIAVEIGEILSGKGFDLDLKLIEAGAILHDIGRAKTHSVHHAIAGAEIAKELGMPESIVSILRRHVGGGITHEEAIELGWAEGEDYMPKSLEEKVVSYADKLVQGSARVPISLTVEELNAQEKPEAAERVKRLHEEISLLLRS